jgi:hypothetical protein
LHRAICCSTVGAEPLGSVVDVTKPVRQRIWGGGNNARRFGRRHHPFPGHRINKSVAAASVSGEAELAWALADTADDHLDVVQRNTVYVSIGVGETFTAICLLIDTIESEGLTLDHVLAVQLSTWLNAYVGHDDEPRLRRLIQVIQARAMRLRPSSRN